LIYKEFSSIFSPSAEDIHYLEFARNQIIGISSGIYKKFGKFICPPTVHYSLHHFFENLDEDGSALLVRNEGIESHHKQTKKNSIGLPPYHPYLGQSQQVMSRNINHFNFDILF